MRQVKCKKHSISRKSVMNLYYPGNDSFCLFIFCHLHPHLEQLCRSITTFSKLCTCSLINGLCTKEPISSFSLLYKVVRRVESQEKCRLTRVLKRSDIQKSHQTREQNQSKKWHLGQQTPNS